MSKEKGRFIASEVCGPMHKPDNPHFSEKPDKVINRFLILPFIFKT